MQVLLSSTLPWSLVTTTTNPVVGQRSGLFSAVSECVHYTVTDPPPSLPSPPWCVLCSLLGSSPSADPAQGNVCCLVSLLQLPTNAYHPIITDLAQETGSSHSPSTLLGYLQNVSFSLPNESLSENTALSLAEVRVGSRVTLMFLQNLECQTQL